jgi:hypothetical protein
LIKLCEKSGVFIKNPAQEMSAAVAAPASPAKQGKFQCCGSGRFIPDGNFFHPESWIRMFPIPDPHQRVEVF